MWDDRRPVRSYAVSIAALDRRVFGVVLAFFLYIGARTSVLTFLAIYLVTERSIAASIVGLGVLAESLTRAAVGPIVGALSDRIGRRALLIASAAANAFIMPAFLLVADPWSLVAWSVAVGIVTAPLFPVGTALLLDLAPAARRRSVLALNYTALALGYAAGIAPAGFLVARGFPLLGAWSALLFACAVGILAFAVRGALPRDQLPTGEGLAASSVRAFADRPFLTLAALAMLYPLGIGLFVGAVPLYAADIGVTTAGIGLILALNGLVGAALALPINARLEGRGPFSGMALASGLYAVALLALYVSEVPALIAAVVAFTVGELIFSAAVPAAVAALTPAGLRGAYQGAWSAAFSLSIGSALAFAGVGRDALGWGPTWTAFAALGVLAGVGFLLLTKRLSLVAASRMSTASAQVG
jgi:MFS family permease